MLADVPSIYLSSLPDLIPMKNSPYAPLSFAGLPKDDSALSVLWVRPAQSVIPYNLAQSQSLFIPQTSPLSSDVEVLPTNPVKPFADPDMPAAPKLDPVPAPKEDPLPAFVAKHDFVLDTPQSYASLPILVESSSEKPRAISEGAIPTPLKKLKLSLKLPYLSRVQSASLISPKSVKFASRLENVKMFDGKDSPSSVSLQNSPLGSPNSSLPRVNDYFSIPRSFGDLVLSDSESESDDEASHEMLYRINNSNFVAPQNIYDKKNCPVYLQKAMLSPDKKSLVLIVMCQNLAFEKSLSLKLTFNEWKSQLIFNNSSYVSLFASANFDQFKFCIPLTHLPSAISPEFCLKYTVNKTTYWDNNDGRNYQFSLSAVARTKTSRRDTIALKPRSNDTFSYKPPTFSQSVSFHLDLAPTSSKPEPAGGRATTTNADIEELVNKLKSVKESTECPAPVRPSLLRGSSLPADQRSLPQRSSSLQALRPRYSKSYKNKTADPMSPLGNKGADRDLGTRDTQRPLSMSDAALHLLGSMESRNYVAKPSEDLKSSEIGSMSYADLLQKYCFNGAQNGPHSAASSPFESMASSRSSSNTSLCSEYAGRGSSFQQASSAFFI